MEISFDFEPILYFLSGKDKTLNCSACSTDIKNMIETSRVALIGEITKERHEIIYSRNSPYAIYVNNIPYDISAFRPNFKNYMERELPSNPIFEGQIITLMAEVYYEKINLPDVLQGKIIQPNIPRYLIFINSKENKMGFVNIR